MIVESNETQDIVETATTENNSEESQENQEGKQQEQEAQEPEQQEPEKPKRNRAQERIEQLARENAELKRKQSEYEAKQNEAEVKRPKVEEFESYADYEDALEEYHIAKAEQRVLSKINKQESEKSHNQRQNEMHVAIETFATEHDDFDSIVQGGLARNLPIPVSLDELSAEFGYDGQTQVRLLYELAKDEKFHEEISNSSKLKAARLLSERVDSWGSSKTPPAVSKAPKPITPVQANAATTRDPSKMSDDEWYRSEKEKRKGK